MDRRRTITFFLAGLVTVLSGTLLAAHQAQAGTDEAPIVVTDHTPSDGAVLHNTPSEIILEFEERLPAVTPSVQLQNESRELQSIGQPIAIQNRMALRVRVLKALPAGKYTFRYLLKPQTGDPVSGDFSFTLEAAQTVTTLSEVTQAVQEAPNTAGLKLDKSSNYSSVLGVLGRFLGFGGLAAVAGALFLIALAWTEGVEYVLTVKHLWTCWAIGVIGCLLTVATAASDKSGHTIARSLVPTEWDKLLETSTGKALVIRLAAMIGCAWVAGRPERVVDHGTKLMALAIPGIALFTYGWSRDYGDHIAAVPAGIVHAVAGAAWLGGALLLVRVVLAGPGEADLVGAVRGFRGIFLLSVLAIVVSGAIQTSIFLGGTGNMTSSSFGRIFLLKILVVAAMAFVATGNRGYTRQRLTRTKHLDGRVAERLHRSVRTEVLAGGVVVLLSAWLMGTTAPGTDLSTLARSNRDVYASEDGTFRAEVTFGPKQVNARVEFHFKLLDPESIEDGVVTLTPNDGKSFGIEIPIDGSPNYGFGPSQGFVFGSSGVWTITINGQGPEGQQLQTISEEFIVKNQDGSTPDSTTSTTEPATTAETVPDTTDGD